MEKFIMFKEKEYVWNNAHVIPYKSADDSFQTFKGVSRQNIIDKDERVTFDVRYFECKPHGFTTLEKHDHSHCVIVLRGEGKILIGKTLHKVGKYDCFIIPGDEPHQLINASEKEPFGFICIVNKERDSFKLLSNYELNDLLSLKSIKNDIRVPNEYGKIND